MVATEVWIARVDSDLGEVNRHWLDDTERARLNAFVAEAEYRRRLTAWCLRRHVMSSLCPSVSTHAWRFDYPSDGKPRLSSPFDLFGIEHNLSHAGQYVSCIVSGYACGVDVELLRDGISGLTDALTPEELDDVRRDSRPDERFLRYWTIKEAVLKMFGVGLACPLRAVRVRLASDGRAVDVEVPSRLSLSLRGGLVVDSWSLPGNHRLATACAIPIGTASPVLREWRGGS
ncbi:4'-phosphopantetheinyl transferase family protein [Rhodopseudomonas palustris]|uniref:4'-phosphopantetheinyl transferase n=1 Tax=Rhodopseudomonas palustris (strain BisB18) TaxID=316056 RepID=Q212W0_RHOPB